MRVENSLSEFEFFFAYKTKKIEKNKFTLNLIFICYAWHGYKSIRSTHITALNSKIILSNKIVFKRSVQKHLIAVEIRLTTFPATHNKIIILVGW